MIVCNNYKAFHGDLEIQKTEGTFRIFNKDFFYDPHMKCWFDNEHVYDENTVIGTYEYISKPDKGCGDSIVVSEDGDELDPCLYDVVEVHNNVTVEVLKCQKCGHVELSWYKE